MKSLPAKNLLPRTLINCVMYADNRRDVVWISVVALIVRFRGYVRVFHCLPTFFFIAL